MPNHKSAAKRVKTSEKARQRNRAYKSAMKTVLKRALTADASTGEAAVRQAGAVLDRMVAKKIVHRNFAANHKAKLAKRLQGLQAAA